jgi:phosphatidylglycerol:prolipoprotein diacylglycerol transferase
MRPVLLNFRLGGAEVALGAYSTFYVLAWVTALVLGTVIAWRRGLRWPRALLVYGVSLAGGIVGARLLDIATNWDVYSADPGQILSFGFQGFSLYGGFILAPAAAVLMARATRLSLWRLLDGAVPAIAAGLVLMRTGCLLKGCCFGDVTSLPWGVTFPAGSPAWSWQVASGEGGVLGLAGLVRPVHPVEVYEMLAALLLGGLAVWLMMQPAERRRAVTRGLARPSRLADGVPFLIFALGFTLFRIGELYLRPHIPGAGEPAWFYPVFHLVLYGLIVAAVGVVLRRRTAVAPQGRESFRTGSLGA